jgi:hypothetical protein
MSDNDDIREFEINLRNFVEKQLPEKHAQIVKKAAMQVLMGVIMETPVDTGRARGNWMVTVGSPARTSIGPEKFGAPGSIPEKKAETQVAEATINKGEKIIKTASPRRQIIWITNNLPYIIRLEEGWSKQTPPNCMVALTVEKVKAQFT